MVFGQIEIVDGPSLFDLLFSLGEGNPTPRKTVCFKGKSKHSGATIIVDVNVAITGLDQEDGSGESWLFRGQIRGQQMTLRTICGVYSTRLRDGHYKFVDPNTPTNIFQATKVAEMQSVP